MPLMKGERLWKKSDLAIIEPPQKRKVMGRPKTSRRKDPQEPQKAGLISRRGTMIMCSVCKEYGHNKATYKKKSAPNHPDQSSLVIFFFI